MPCCGATFDENSVPLEPRSKQHPPLDGDFRGVLVGSVIDNLVWVVDPETHPGAPRPLSLRATPPTEGIFRGTVTLFFG